MIGLGYIRRELRGTAGCPVERNPGLEAFLHNAKQRLLCIEHGTPGIFKFQEIAGSLSYNFV